MSNIVFSITRGATFHLLFNMERRAMPVDQDIGAASVQRAFHDEPLPGTFWDALDEYAREDFMSLADMRTFAAGARLMEEGEPADHVAVISSGRARILVRNDGRERTIAERGPGELVGERAALRFSVRSATVVALETVRAFVVKTEDFATFVSEHPGVLHTVEGQIYRRLTERPVGGESRSGTRFRGENCTIVYTDVVGFAARTRNDLDRLKVREAIADITMAAFGSYWDACSFADRGDGLLVVVPPDVATTELLKRLIAVFPTELRRHNATHITAEQIELRIAVVVGPVVADAMGVSGEAIIRAARMLEAPAFKAAMAEHDSVLGVIASDFVYETAIKHGGAPLDPADYVPVLVDVKESQLGAWLWLMPRAS